MSEIKSLLLLISVSLICCSSFGQKSGSASIFNTPVEADFTVVKINSDYKSNKLKSQSNKGPLKDHELRNENDVLGPVKKGISNLQLKSGGADAGGGNYNGISLAEVKAELMPGLNKLDHEIDKFLTSAYLLKLINVDTLKDEQLKKVVTSVLYGFSTQHQLTQQSIGRWNFQEDPITKKHFDTIINAIRYKTQFLENEHCRSNLAEHNVASTNHELGATICLSLLKLSKYPKKQLLNIALPIIFHEIAHQYGFNETTSKKFEIYIRDLYEKHKILQLNLSLQNQLKILLNTNYSNSLQIARAYETKGILYNKIRNSNYIDLFMLTNFWGMKKDVEGFLTKIYRPPDGNVWRHLAPEGYARHYSNDPLVIDDPALKNDSVDNSQMTINEEVSILLNSTELIDFLIRTSSSY